MGQIDQIAELLGQFVCQKVEMSQKQKPLITDAELTFNRVAIHLELFQIHEVSELLRQLSCKKK